MRSLTPCPSSLWCTLDALLIRQLADDLELLEAYGDPGAFALFVADRLRAEFGNGFDDAFAAAEFSTRALGPLPGELLARRILPGVDACTIGDALTWHHHRRRLRLVVGLVRDEAASIRAEMGRREARR